MEIGFDVMLKWHCIIKSEALATNCYARYPTTLLPNWSTLATDAKLRRLGRVSLIVSFYVHHISLLILAEQPIVKSGPMCAVPVC